MAPLPCTLGIFLASCEVVDGLDLHNEAHPIAALRLSSGGRVVVAARSPFSPRYHCTGPLAPAGVLILAGLEEFFMATDLRLKETLPEITEAIVATYTE